MPIQKVLVANRGEIACRIFRTARRLGFRTVAVYSVADSGAPHVALADEALCVGEAPASESYLCVERIIDACKRSGADAIHPGYGFLSESPELARAAEGAGIGFIGPPVAAIELMGNKRAAKVRMAEAGVPIVPGYSGADQSDAVLVAEAERVGFPLMVKAAAGGGGRGMRLVTDSGDLADALVSARAEARSAFGNDELILERAVVRPRHVEVQVFGDTHGNLIHLGERDCSVQRRHQKVVEESPSPAVDEDLRARMGKAAVDAARTVRYVGAGTVEFLLDDAGDFYFLEMNTRLQVEHPVTELVTGLDLVEWQFRVAEGEPLPLDQEGVRMNGHAIEVRLYAEDAGAGFVPQTGRVITWALPDDARVDAGVAEGSVVSSYYDPMLAKVIVHAPSRTEACRKLGRALSDLTLFGVVSNKGFLRAIVEHAAFVEGRATTAFLAEHHEAVSDSGRPTLRDLAVGALISMVGATASYVEDLSYVGWHTAGPLWSTFVFAHRESEQTLRVTTSSAGRRFAVESVGDNEGVERLELEIVSIEPGEVAVAIDGVRHRIRYARDGEQLWLDDGRRTVVMTDVTHRPVRAEGGAGSGRIMAPLDGAVRALMVGEGAQVVRGQTLLVLEAMKMEHPIKADVDGRVDKVHPSEGAQVKTRQLLVEITPEEGP